MTTESLYLILTLQAIVLAGLIVAFVYILCIASRITRLGHQMAAVHGTGVEAAPPHSPPSPDRESQQACTTADEEDKETMAWIDQQIDETQLYCQPDLNLKKMASSLGLTQRRTLAALKSDSSAPTFSEYITLKRLTHACRLLTDEPNWTIDAVARDAGFAATTTFRTIFRTRLGMSPSQYRERKRRALQN